MYMNSVEIQTVKQIHTMYEFHTVGGLHGGPHNIESCQNWWVQAFTGVGSDTYCKQCTLVMRMHACVCVIYQGFQISFLKTFNSKQIVKKC